MGTNFGGITSGNRSQVSINSRDFFRKKYLQLSKNPSTNKNQNDSIMPLGRNATANPTSTSQQGSQQNASWGAVTNAMSQLNQICGSNAIATPSSAKSSPNALSMSSLSGNGGNAALSTSNPEYSQYSGYAQNITTGLASVDTSRLAQINSLLDNNSLEDWTAADFASVRTDIAEESFKINQSLAEAQANYNSLQSQKATAEANVTRLQGAVDGAQHDKQGAQQSLDTSKTALDDSITKRDEADKQLSAQNEQYKKDCEAVKTAEGNKTSAQQEVSSAKTALGQAQAAVNIADQALSSAEAELAGTSQVNEDGTPNPAYQIAKAKVERARIQKEQAEKSLQQAEQTLTAAEEKLNAAEQSLTEAQTAKDKTLEALTSQESTCKELAEQCKTNQGAVEENQDNYDNSLQVYDDARSNHERLNTELEAQEGILTQYEAVENQVDAIKDAADSVKAIDEEIDERLANNSQTSISQDEKREAMESTIIENANKDGGCSASKTPLENMIACKDVDISNMSAQLLTEGTVHTRYGADDFKAWGYVANSDGSYTDPRTGVTLVDALGNGSTWVTQDYLARTVGHDTTYTNHNLSGKNWSGAIDAGLRAREQKNIALNGFAQDGTPKFRWL